MSWLSLSRRRDRDQAPLTGQSGLLSLRDQMNRLFNDTFADFGLGSWPTSDQMMAAPAFVPRVDVRDVGDSLQITADLPGMEPDQVDLSVHGDALVIRGERRNEHEQTNDDNEVVYLERQYGSFERTVRLGFEADADHIEAKFRNGVLTVTVPKPIDEQLKSRRIEIQS